jgi:hypothetical protein
MTFVDIGDEFYVVAEEVVAVKKIDENKCSLWLKGQNAEHGFVVEKGARELVQELCDACVDESEDEPEE